MPESTNTPSIFKQALTVNKKPFPWLKAFLAGLAAGLPVVIGLLFGNLQYGLLAGMGGFTYLYVFPIPYAQLAKKLFSVVLAITLCVFLGTLLAPYPLLIAIFMGLIGGITVFIFGSLKLIGPSAIFLVLIFAMTSGMPVAPELAPLRAGLAFLGGALSWIIAMSGWFFNPHGPEVGVVKRVYRELALFMNTIDTNKNNDAQHRVMAILKEADQTLAAGYIPWHSDDQFNRLVALNNYANKIFLYTVEHFSEKNKKLPSEIAESLTIIFQLIDSKTMYEDASKNLPHPDEMTEEVALLFIEITDAKDCLVESSVNLQKKIKLTKPSLKTIFLGAFDKNSIVLINALRFTAFTILAAIIAYEFNFARSFWVPLSCVAVMSGSTAVATFHRAIQRGLGTVAGILIASVILALHPSGFFIALLIFLLTFITELFIVKNYGLAALFFTPSALLMAESVSHGDFSFTYFATARIMDVAIGIVIGLIGVWLVGRKSASSRLPHLISKTIRSQAQFLFVLFSEQGNGYKGKKIREAAKMQTNINNMKTLYATATGEIPVDKKALEYYWSVVFSIEELGFLLEECSKLNDRPMLSDETLAELLYIFESIANAADQKIATHVKEVPIIKDFPSVQYAIKSIQTSLKAAL